MSHCCSLSLPPHPPQFVGNSSSGELFGWRVSGIVLGICAGIILFNEPATATQIAGLAAAILGHFIIRHAYRRSFENAQVRTHIAALSRHFGGEMDKEDAKALVRVHRLLGFDTFSRIVYQTALGENLKQWRNTAPAEIEARKLLDETDSRIRAWAAQGVPGAQDPVFQRHGTVADLETGGRPDGQQQAGTPTGVFPHQQPQPSPSHLQSPPPPPPPSAGLAARADPEQWTGVSPGGARARPVPPPLHVAPPLSGPAPPGRVASPSNAPAGNNNSSNNSPLRGRTPSPSAAAPPPAYMSPQAAGPPPSGPAPPVGDRRPSARRPSAARNAVPPPSQQTRAGGSSPPPPSTPYQQRPSMSGAPNTQPTPMSRFDEETDREEAGDALDFSERQRRQPKERRIEL